MSLWVDKHRPRDLASLDYHEGLTKSLSALAASDDFPHLLFYGPSGAGKKTRVMAVLKGLYGNSVSRIKTDGRIVQAGSKKVEFNILSSTYHIEITPSDMGNQDRVIIQDLLKEIAQSQQVDTTARHKFKVVVINEADSLTRDAQSALRRTMEKYSPNIRLILIANTTSNIMAPIRSRTLLVRVASPSAEEMGRVLEEVAMKENVDIQDAPTVFANITKEANGNMRKALLMLEAMYAQNNRITPESTVPPADWELVISKLAANILKDRSVDQLVSARGIFYELISHCIPPTVIIKNLGFALMKRLPETLIPEIAQWTSFYDHRIRLGSKAIFHLEAYAARVMRTVEEYQMKR
ncbi:replication factor C subunit 5 [Trichomonascus vanleenenianus]|uniref:replication factor C subunit 5 n=1 Tax=Trichomonascus vanleenenianus TaxID=2268995 RepID=UPI003ECB9137